jgi:hypothetical protein
MERDVEMVNSCEANFRKSIYHIESNTLINNEVTLCYYDPRNKKYQQLTVASAATIAVPAGASIEPFERRAEAPREEQG